MTSLKTTAVQRTTQKYSHLSTNKKSGTNILNKNIETFKIDKFYFDESLSLIPMLLDQNKDSSSSHRLTLQNTNYVCFIEIF